LSSSSWTTADIPDLSGRRALVTGVTGGLGHHVVLELARTGAEVLATARDIPRGKESLDAIHGAVPNARVELVELDLADLASVRDAAARIVADGRPLDICVNIAGVMAAPQRQTVDGFELQIGTNHVGHFALVGGLWPAIVAAPAARVVTVSSLMHWLVRDIKLRCLDPDADQGRYRKWAAYSESKLANLVYATELGRRVRTAGLAVESVAAHPGYSATGLQHAGLAMGNYSLERFVVRIGTWVVAQSAAAGAAPLLQAATDPSVPSGAYIGPGSPGEARGAPKPAGMSKAARDHDLGRRLWAASEAATGVTYP